MKTQNQQDLILKPQNVSNTSYATKKNNYAGRHYIIDFWGAKFLENADVLESALKDAANIAGAVLLHIHLHRFSSGGITGVALLAESHISVHTWPEKNYAAFDVFMCGDAKPEDAVAWLKKIFQPSSVDVKEIFRGNWK